MKHFFLQAVASQIDLPDDFVYYFGLFLVKKEDGGDNSCKDFVKHDSDIKYIYLLMI